MSLAMPSPRAPVRATTDLAPEILRRVARGGLVTLGGLIVVAGVVIAPLPGPGGIPEIAPVFWQQYLRVERFALPKRYRLGVRGRQFVKRHFGGAEG
jgi:hypothetical protein